MSRHVLEIVSWALAAIVATSPHARAEPPKLARPPKFPPDVQNVFFDDTRKELKGDRPDYEHLGPNATASPASAGGDSDAASSFPWSKLIDADTIESEIKRLSTLIDKDVTTPTEFKGGSYKLCRRDFSLL